jgi:hypothetical protein
VDAPHGRSTSWARSGAPHGGTGSGNAVTPHRPGSAVTAAWLGVTSAVLLLGSVVALVADVPPAGAGASWAPALGAVLTCAPAGAGLLGAVSLLCGTGRGLLLTAAWVQAAAVGIALVSAGVSLAGGTTSAGTAVAVLVIGGAALALAAGTIRLGGRREVLGWLESSAAWRGVTPGERRRPGAGLTVAVLAPVVLLAGVAVAAVAASGGSAGVPAPTGLALRPATTPPTTVAEFVPDARACADGSMRACDDLYWQSSVGDVHERYGSTCGGRVTRELEGGCAATLGPTLN